MAFMIDSSHNRFVRVTNPAGPARQHAILFLVAVANSSFVSNTRTNVFGCLFTNLYRIRISSTKKMTKFRQELLRALFLQKVTTIERPSCDRYGALFSPGS
jgi:hypothetical protein